MKMEIGCGARIREFDGRRYFYFWHYERDNGRSTRKEDYVGRVDSERAKAVLMRRMAAYHRNAEQEFARKRARIERLIAANHTSTERYEADGGRVRLQCDRRPAVGNLYPTSSLRRGVRLEERPYGGFARGALPVGCRQCTDGSKMVLFVTGICSFHCFYCPVSDEKMYKDVVFADEKRVTRDEDVLEEAHAIQATGAGITGGDPLDAVERTCHYIRLLKHEFGPGFHTHLYTMSTDADKIRRLADAGLDEIRLHVPPGLWSRAASSAFVGASRLARSLGLTVGIEVPLIPEREADLVRLIEWAGAEGLAFVNLNEMEFSEANFPRMKVHGYAMKHELSYGVKGADVVALRILERRWKTTVHYCTSGYKDGWQLRSRIKRRAENVAHPWDVITEDGTLLKGIVEGADLEPLMRDLANTYHVPTDLMGVDGPRKRLEIAPWILEEIASKLHRPAFLVEEYPTSDGLEVERTRLA